MTLINVNLTLAFKTKLELNKMPEVLTSLHSFTDNIVLCTEKCATPNLFHKTTLMILPKKIPPNLFF